MRYVRPLLIALLAGVAALTTLGATPGTGPGATHRIAFQVDQNDAAVMNLVLNNVVNAATTFDARGEATEIEVVAYGPGLHMLRADDSPVKDRLRSIKQSMPNVTFSACNFTKTGMEKAEGHPIAIVPEARIVPSGAVRLVELQERGWSYLKP